MNKKIKLSSRSLRIAAGTIIAGSLLVITGTNILAGLNATATATQNNSAGTLSLTTANNGVGFSQAITNLAPGDTVNRYVTLTNGGSLDAQQLGLSIAATGTSTLITDGVSPSTTKALTITVNSCTGGTWNPTTGVCSGTTNTEVATTTLSAMNSTKVFAISSSIASLATANLQIQVKLPDQNETTANGVAPANTIQNGAVTLNYLFSEAQRNPLTANS